MSFLLKLSRLIDGISEWIGKLAMWLVLAAVLISAGNAIMRKAFDMSSNAYLEIQWYLFSAIFLLGASYTLMRNEHVRIDVLAGRLSARGQNWIDVIGIVFFLLPMAALIAWLSWPVFVDQFRSGEMSSSPGGLIRWPVRLLVPIGFGLLVLQGISELIKRIAFLRGLIPNPLEKHTAPTAEELLAAAIKAEKEKANKKEGA
jgi:TRAP-type mannitol/chloroaromatic compound transport system permease small subunit